MPAVRTSSKFFKTSACQEDVAEAPVIVDAADVPGIFYPLSPKDRASYRDKDGKAVTDFQFAVYDFIRGVPVGKVTTYKDICAGLGQGSPRSVGAALRRNPFAPYIPCHRVIASTHFVGGFCGEWGNKSGGGVQVDRKVELLKREGVRFTSSGYLSQKTSVWIEAK